MTLALTQCHNYYCVVYKKYYCLGLLEDAEG